MEGDGGRGRELHDGTLTVRVEADAGARTLALAGELDMANASTLSGELERAEGEGAGSIVVDLRELEFIDSTGIAILVAAHHRLNGETVRIRLVRSASTEVQRVMGITGLDREMPFVDGDV